MPSVPFASLAAFISLLALAPSIAGAAILKPVAVTASSNYPEDAGVRYEPENVADRKVSNVWVEGEEGSGLGSWVNLDLGASFDVTSITIWNGNWYSWDFWNRHNRAKNIEVEFSDGSVQKFTLKDEKVAETINLPKPVKTTSVKVRIKEIYRGTTFNDSCFSEIEVRDATPEKWHVPSAFTDSGHLAEDADGSYGVDNTYDGILDTMWCENNKAGDGTGSWFEQKFPYPVPVSKLVLRNGNAFDLKFWMLSNRAKSATLVFSDGSKESVSIKDTLMEQTVTFPSHTTNSVRVVFGEVVKGQKYNDLCTSEAHFAE